MNKKLIAGAAALIIAFSAVQIQPVLSGDAGTHSIQITAEASKKSNSKKTNKSSSLASKAVKVKEKDLKYYYDAVYEGVIITGYNGKETSIKIPSKIDGDKVVGVEITNNTAPHYIEVPEGVKFVNFYSCYFLEEISLPESLETLKYKAFCSCSRLKSVSLPKSITTIPESCFWNCYSLEEIKMPGVKYIMRSAFGECQNLKIKISSQYKYIGTDAFTKCDSLTNITIPYIKTVYDESDRDNKKEGLGVSIFSNCDNLKKVTSYSNIEENMFRYCEALEEVVLITDKNNKEEMFIIDTAAFSGCKSLRTVDFSKCKKPIKIRGFAFASCESLRSLKLPSDTIVEKNAFSNCKSLTVTYKGKKYNYSNFDELYALFN